jgi:hypothetical protein
MVFYLSNINKAERSDSTLRHSLFDIRYSAVRYCAPLKFHIRPSKWRLNPAPWGVYFFKYQFVLPAASFPGGRQPYKQTGQQQNDDCEDKSHFITLVAVKNNSCHPGSQCACNPDSRFDKTIYKAENLTL